MPPGTRNRIEHASRTGGVFFGAGNFDAPQRKIIAAMAVALEIN
jgi:hypothetical protein